MPIPAAPRISYIIPPELRRLRTAWAVIGTTSRRIRAMTSDCAIFTETPGEGGWMMTGTASNGAGIAIRLRADTLLVIRYGDVPAMVAVPLPAPLCHRIPATGAPLIAAQPGADTGSGVPA